MHPVGVLNWFPAQLKQTPSIGASPSWHESQPLNDEHVLQVSLQLMQVFPSKNFPSGQVIELHYEPFKLEPSKH